LEFEDPAADATVKQQIFNALIISGKLSALEVFYLIFCQHDPEERLTVASSN